MFQGMNVTFTGMLQGEELSQAYASADIFITPSESETLGFVVLEAMASGVSVVAARAGGIPDIVTQDGETGFLYTPGDLDDCLSKIMALLESSELRQKIGAAGTAHFWASMTLLLDKCFKGRVRAGHTCSLYIHAWVCEYLELDVSGRCEC
jgi:glycosyltransferase involved in cell wall biosynthesis